MCRGGKTCVRSSGYFDFTGLVWLLVLRARVKRLCRIGLCDSKDCDYQVKYNVVCSNDSTLSTLVLGITPFEDSSISSAAAKFQQHENT